MPSSRYLYRRNLKKSHRHASYKIKYISLKRESNALDFQYRRNKNVMRNVLYWKKGDEMKKRFDERLMRTVIPMVWNPTTFFSMECVQDGCLLYILYMPQNERERGRTILIPWSFHFTDKSKQPCKSTSQKIITYILPALKQERLKFPCFVHNHKSDCNIFMLIYMLNTHLNFKHSYRKNWNIHSFHFCSSNFYHPYIIYLFHWKYLNSIYALLQKNNSSQWTLLDR